MTSKVRAARVIFSNSSPVGHLLASNPQELHAFTMKVLTDPTQPTSRQDGNLLWRIDTLRGGTPALTVQTTDPGADFKAWDRSAGVHSVEVVEDALTRIEGKLVPGGVLRFAVRGNPTRWGRRGTTKVRVPITSEAEQIEWLANRGRGAFTFATDPFTQMDAVAVEHEAPVKVQPRGATFNSASFKGELVVTDPEAMRNLLTSGIGRGRAFGFGLFQVA